MKRKSSGGELVGGIILLIVGVPALGSGLWLDVATSGSPIAQITGFSSMFEFVTAVGALFTALGALLVWRSRG